MTSPPALDGPLRSVGRVAREIGIPAATLRMWERRYANPVPLRLPSGHRRYAPAQVALLRRVAEGLARGLRPRALLTATPARLDELLGASSAPAARAGALAAVHALDAPGLEGWLRTQERAADTPAYLEERVAPFLAALGAAWAAGALGVRHEHFAAEVVGERLRARRRALLARPGAAPAGLLLLATLPGERHTLALHGLALVAAEARVEARTFAADAPLEEIARACADTGAGALAISVSLAGGGPPALRALARLRELLPEPIELLAGGAGLAARRGPRGVRVLRDLRALAAWLEAFRARAAAGEEEPGGR